MIDQIFDIHPVCHPQFRSTIVRESLRHHKVACAGFSLGRLMPDGRSPRLDFPLVAVTFKDSEAKDYERKFQELVAFRETAEETAAVLERSVLGLWAAWDYGWIGIGGVSVCELQDALATVALTLNIPFITTLATVGGDPMWPVEFWSTRHYPHQGIFSTKSKEKSNNPNDNPRRAKSEWRRQLASRNLRVPE